MAKRLNGSAGTGKKILQNLSSFSYAYNGTESLNDNSSLHKFNWTFDNQSGYASIVVQSNGKIDQSSLIGCTNNASDFRRPLGAYNDPSLYPVFQMMLDSVGITYTY